MGTPGKKTEERGKKKKEAENYQNKIYAIICSVLTPSCK
jgi:hypothetical protein